MSGRKLRAGKALFLCILLFVGILGLSGCRGSEEQADEKDYGVFLSLDSSEIEKIAEYRTVVIDAQYFSEEDITYLKSQGCTVLSYINVGSLENFRDYYEEYESLTLGAYENWDEERWMNVSSTDWQDFLILLEEELLAKKVDGFFVDNCDVYYVYHSDEIFDGLTAILEHMMEYGKPVVINGGDTFVMEYEQQGGDLSRIMTGVNQESVFSEIDFDKGEFAEQTKSNREYFQEYVEKCKEHELDVYLIEYTKDDTVKQKIVEYCTKSAFHYYISDSVELD